MSTLDRMIRRHGLWYRSPCSYRTSSPSRNGKLQCAHSRLRMNFISTSCYDSSLREGRVAFWRRSWIALRAFSISGRDCCIKPPDIRSPWTKPLLPIPDAVATDAVFRPAHRASTCLLRSKERTKKLSTVVHSNECPESPALDLRRHHLGRHARARARILIRGTRDQR